MACLFSLFFLLPVLFIIYKAESHNVWVAYKTGKQYCHRVGAIIMFLYSQTGKCIAHVLWHPVLSSQTHSFAMCFSADSQDLQTVLFHQ